MLGLTSCQLFDAKPAAVTAYNPTTAPMATRAAFLQQTWVDAAYRGKPIKHQFSAVYIAPVNTRYMENHTWWQQQSVKNKSQLASDTRKIATNMRNQFNQTIANYPGGGIKLANGPGPGVLVIELALVELVPSKAYWNAGATAAGFVIPGAGFLSMAGAGSIAMEGRVRDGGSNQIIATFKDRRNDKAAPINIGSYTWYHGAETNINDWAAEFAELLNTPPGHVVKRASAVTLKPW
ncbi:MAG: hypothetical protein RLZZ282_428 [Verrucomicrobiota bacterium]